jgi:single-strand DNA-binding protein
MSFAKIMMIGNLGRDPELRSTPQGTPVCDLSVAVSRRFKSETEVENEHTTWYRVTCWRRLAEIAAQYLTKGSPLYVEGTLSVDEWVDREGKVRFTLKVDATELHLLGKAAQTETQPAPPPALKSASSEPKAPPRAKRA